MSNGRGLPDIASLISHHRGSSPGQPVSEPPASAAARAPPSGRLSWLSLSAGSARKGTLGPAAATATPALGAAAAAAAALADTARAAGADFLAQVRSSAATAVVGPSSHSRVNGSGTATSSGYAAGSGPTAPERAASPEPLDFRRSRRPAAGRYTRGGVHDHTQLQASAAASQSLPQSLASRIASSQLYASVFKPFWTFAESRREADAAADAASAAAIAAAAAEAADAAALEDHCLAPDAFEDRCARLQALATVILRWRLGIRTQTLCC